MPEIPIPSRHQLPPDETDEDLMRDVAEGNMDALRPLFQRHAQPLFGFFYRISRDYAGSEDLVQEVFGRIVRYRQSYKPGSAFRPWAYRIARNLLNDRIRHWHGDRVVPFINEPENEAAADEPSPVETCEREDDKSRLAKALALLPQAQREVLVLARFESLTFAEVGEVLGCREGTAKVRAFRALQALREIFISLGVENS